MRTGRTGDIFISLEEARKNRLKADWEKVKITQPAFYGTTSLKIIHWKSYGLISTGLSSSMPGKSRANTPRSSMTR